MECGGDLGDRDQRHVALGVIDSVEVSVVTESHRDVVLVRNGSVEVSVGTVSHEHLALGVYRSVEVSVVMESH